MKVVAVHRYAETMILSALTITFCLLSNAQDPLFIHASFPWVWLLPILIALRHGRECAAISVCFIVFIIIYTLRNLLYSWDSYQMWFLGGITVVIICAEYQNLWVKRQFGLYEREGYLNTRLKSLTEAYGVLRLSHDRLEESLINKPNTLREALYELRKLLFASPDLLNSIAVTQYIELIVYQTGITSLALYLYDGKEISKFPIAAQGKHKELNTNDILIKRCLKKHHTAYIALNILEENQTSDYLAVVPMKTADNKLLAILVIYDISFMLLNDETLKKVALLLSYIADEVSSAKNAKQIQEIYPDCPSLFASELLKLMHLYTISKIDSTVAIFCLEPHEDRNDILFTILKERRDLDIYWESMHDETIILLILMPLTERAMLKGYFERMQDLLWRRKEIKLGDPPVLFNYKQISDYDDAYTLLKGIFEHDIV